MALNDEETRLVAEMQADMAAIKTALVAVAKNARAMAVINSKAGRGAASAKALKFQGAMLRIRGEVVEAHADASIALAEAYGADGEVIAYGMGGGR